MVLVVGRRWCGGGGGVATHHAGPSLTPSPLSPLSPPCCYRCCPEVVAQLASSSPYLLFPSSPSFPLHASSRLSLTTPLRSFPFPRLSSPRHPLPTLTPALLPPLINSSHMPSETHSEPIAATYHNSRPLLRPSRGTWPHPKSRSNSHAFKEAAVCPGRLISLPRRFSTLFRLTMQHVGV